MDSTGFANPVLLVGVSAVVVSMLGKLERIATALEQLAFRTNEVESEKAQLPQP